MSGDGQLSIGIGSGPQIGISMDALAERRTNETVVP